MIVGLVRVRSILWVRFWPLDAVQMLTFVTWAIVVRLNFVWSMRCRRMNDGKERTRAKNKRVIKTRRETCGVCECVCVTMRMAIDLIDHECKCKVQNIGEIRAVADAYGGGLRLGFLNLSMEV